MSTHGAWKFSRLVRITLIFFAILLATLWTGHHLYRHSSHRGYDHYVGWYHMPDLDRKTRQPILNDPRSPGRLIRIFKRGDTFYTVDRYVECPLRAADDKLAWNISPSSLTGTTFGFDRDAGQYYLELHDSNGESFSESYIDGERRPMTRTNAPDWFTDAPTPTPQSLDNFLGDYYFAWCPVIRLTLTRNGDKFVSTGGIRSKSGSWEQSPLDPPSELTPLFDRLGLTVINGKNTSLLFNAMQHRYEMVVTKYPDNSQPTSLVIPLLRHDPLQPEAGQSFHMPNIEIGIPAWHG